MGAGAIFLPPDVTSSSFFRSVIVRNPSSPSVPMSPVWNQPSWLSTAAVSSGRFQ